MYTSSHSTKNNKEPIKNSKQYKIEIFGFGEIDIIEVKQSDTTFPKINLQSLKK